ncbi:MAG: hypothetical protein P8Z00_19780 [Anaerolineales bacterium]|jgi:hypothetical protein
MEETDWEALFESEIAQAERARIDGNEGKARVCARRAAGHIIGEYLNRKGLHSPGRSAYSQLQYVQSLPNVSPKARAAAHYFLMRITPEHRLPVEIDLIAEARGLKQALLDD